MAQKCDLNDYSANNSISYRIILVTTLYGFFWYHYLEHTDMFPSGVVVTKSDTLGLGMRQGEMTTEHLGIYSTALSYFTLALK